MLTDKGTSCSKGDSESDHDSSERMYVCITRQDHCTDCAHMAGSEGWKSRVYPSDIYTLLYVHTYTRVRCLLTHAPYGPRLPY